MIPDKLIAGTQFYDPIKSKTPIITIHQVQDDDVYWTQGGKTIHQWKMTELVNAMRDCGYLEYKEKPLDKAMKQLDKEYCTHKNVRRDHYFSAMVYLTCKDCGKALN